ncbi:hypothetical protein [Geobacter pickeringii]|uniref:Uncharacterized protein n=1 Tax=Geobacter pickeringii TaxID=345632 RepID=A0A0B5BFE7_9BACT|nr:hypothetical protein [Geobacter pickeringii]AJE02796.1 hypothetical protein GPICK_04920 [Geobacter pickeringii]
MTFQRTFIASVILHVAVALLLSRFASTRPVADIQTNRWIVDLNTSLLADDAPVSPPTDIPTPSTGPVLHDDLPSPPETLSSPDADTKHQTPSAPEPATAGTDPGASLQAEPSLSAGTNQMMQMNHAFMNTMNMQSIIVKTRQYYSVAAKALKGMVESSLTPEDAAQLEGYTGTIVVTYGKGNGPDSFDIATDNEHLRALLKEKVRWDAVPSPQGYLLPFSKVAFTIGVIHGRIGIGISPS